MGVTRSLDVRIDEKQRQYEEMLKRAEQYKAQLKQLEARKKDQDRRARTHKLCEIGGAVLSVLNCDASEVDVEKLIFFLRDQENRGHYFTKAMGISQVDVNPLA